ncbi:MAG: hypothetical protein GF333_02990 [Candidatus Omnitrophica bacterium]|nr:hypothetical protein [Candidatus Omnitrophota bacterium]
MNLYITSGDPAGCGPAITLSALQTLTLPADLDITLIGEREIYRRNPGFDSIAGRVRLLDTATSGIGRIRFGTVSSITGRSALRGLETACELLKKKPGRLVTAPLSKEAVQQVSPGFRGHTEYLAGQFSAARYAMLMKSPAFSTVLFTRHIPARLVPQRIQPGPVRETLELIHRFFLAQDGIETPRIGIAALNPHAGIDTYLGKEERVIMEAVSGLPFQVEGPYPADTIFMHRDRYDCILAMYHDQGMIPFKLLAFREGVNMTIGLPFIRTSPAHGVALDLMRNGIDPDPASMKAAIHCALSANPIVK